MRIRTFSIAIVAVASVLSGAPAHASDVVREPVSFSVTNPMTPGAVYTVRGNLVRPVEGCSSSVLLAMHGLSYGAWAWDFPVQPETTSVALALAERGFATLAVDELGYGASAGPGAADHPNGYALTVEAYADMAAQIATQLRAGTYTAASPTAFAHVGLIGHSAGSEISELAAAEHPGLFDVLIPTAYTHEPYVDNNWLVREWVSDNQRAAMSDYEYFETNPSIRARDMYFLPGADPVVVAWDTANADLTPSGEIYSIGLQPSRFVVASITIPVLLVLGELDALFPASFGPSDLAFFAGASDKTLLVAPQDGHAFMLQRNARRTDAKIADWLDARTSVFPPC